MSLAKWNIRTLVLSSSERIKAVGFGKNRPIAENSTAEGRANNRRVEIVIQRREPS